MISVLDVVRRLAMARPDVGFTLNNKWRFPKNQNMNDRIVAVMGDDVAGRMIPVDAFSASDAGIELHGFISEPTLRRASSVDQYLFVNGRPVKDKVLVGALRAAYMDVMHAREFPLCALYLTVPPRSVDVNVSPAKTEVHFLEPAHIRGFIIKNLRAALARTMNQTPNIDIAHHTPREFEMSGAPAAVRMDFGIAPAALRVHQPEQGAVFKPAMSAPSSAPSDTDAMQPLGRVIGQIGNKYILAASGDNLVVVDQHAAHERITYEKLRQHTIKTQPLLTPIVVSMRADDVVAVLTVADEMRASGLHIDAFGDDAIAIFEKPADWDLNWANLFHDIADEVRANGHSSQLGERLHLKLANYACHHSVRAGQALDMASCDALLRAVENTARAGQCNHGRPVYKFIPIADMDAWFERI